MKEYKVYTDGCCLANPSGPGGFGIVIIDEQGNIEEYSQGYQSTTNNRMELMAFLEALINLPENVRVHFYSDSKYSIGVLSGTMNASKNLDIIEQVKKEMQSRAVEFTWVKGHNNNKYNERCDRLAFESTKRFLAKDYWYENSYA